MAARLAGVRFAQLLRSSNVEEKLIKPVFRNNQNPFRNIYEVKRFYASDNSAESSNEDGAGTEPLEARDPAKDRSKIIPVEVSMSYVNSKAYEVTYGNDPVWKLYRRNFKGQFQPETRKTCIRQDKISTGSPCPVCRDEYLVLDYRNVKLLQQFISPFNGEVLNTKTTGLCQKRHQELLIAIQKAKDYGYITFDLPIKEYDYTEYQHYAK